MTKSMMLLFPLFVSLAAAAETKSIGSALLEEVQDAPSKTYTVTVEVWSADRDAQVLSVTPKGQGEGLTVLTRKQVWKNVPKGKRQKFTASARNASKETRPLELVVYRKSKGRNDTKTISILVPPQ